MKLGFKRGQKGFTLVELMVVMAIMAVLAAIVFPAVSGTQEVSVDSQVKQDAGTVNTAASDYFADQTGAELISTNTTTILGVSSIVQVTSSRWPEQFLKTVYPKVFPSGNSTTVVTVTIISENGTTIAPKDLAEDYNVINLSLLESGSYIPAVPKSSSDMSGTGDREYNNYLWLMEKTTASGGETGASRAVHIFKLVKIDHAESGGLDTLHYEQIY